MCFAGIYRGQQPTINKVRETLYLHNTNAKQIMTCSIVVNYSSTSNIRRRRRRRRRRRSK
jgi:hypothetical protein